MNMKNALTDSRVISAAPEMMGNKPAPTFGETTSASLSYKYAPLMNRVTEKSMFHNVIEDGFVASDNIPEDLLQYGTSMVRATSQAQMDYIASNLRDGLKTRETLARSSFIAQMGAEALDLVNYVSLPFASVNKLRSVGVAGNAVRTGAGTAAVVAGQEAIRAPLDALGTTSETAINIGASALIGGAIGALARVPAARRIKAHKDAVKEIEKFREILEPIDGIDGVEFDANIAPSMFTDSWLFSAVTTPMKRTLQDPDLPNSVKLTTLEIANDAGILLAGNKVGMALKNSVFQNAKLREAEWVKSYDETLHLWGQSTGKGVTQAMDRVYGRAEYEAWMTSVDQKSMRGEKPANEFEARAMASIDNFYVAWEKRLNEQGMLGDKGFLMKDNARREGVVSNLRSQLDGVGVGSTTKNRGRIKSIIEKNESRIKEQKALIKQIDDSGPIKPANEEVFRPRYWDKAYITDNREALEDILYDWFLENPFSYNKRADDQYGRVEMSTRPSDVRKRAVFAVDSILGLKDVTDFDVASFGHGKSKHFKHRGIDIPNKLVLDFIHTNPTIIMKAYTARTAPKYEFAKQFGNKSIDEVLDDKTVEMIRAGMSEDAINAALKDIRHLYDRVAGTVLREPDALNQSIARVMRSAAQLSYLGSAGLSTITEPAKIMMEHGVGKSMQGLLGVLRGEQLRLGAKEARMAGESLEMLMGNAHLRLVEDMGNNPLRSDFLDKGTDAFFTLNGLGPITRLFKDFDGMMRSHTLIDYSVRMIDGTATKMEVEYLARYGVDAVKAKKIADSSWQKSETGFYLADSESWVDLDISVTRAEVRKSHKPSKKSVLKMSEEDLLKRFSDEFYVDRIITDQEIVDGVFTRKGTPNILGNADGTGSGSPATIYLNIANIRSSFNKFKNREDLDEFTKQLDDALEDGLITDTAHAHQMNYVRNAELLATEDDFVEFVLMHELHHTTHFQGVGETIAQYEQRIDGLSISYIKGKRKKGLDLAVEKEHAAKIADARETQKTFRNALGSGIANTILMGTPADKPIITDGIVYIPMRVASQFGMKEDAKFTGYARIENGLLGLPFQFYSYALAATNKTTAAMAHGQLKNQYLGTAIAMGLGYMLLQIKTPNYVEMEYHDQFARAFDYSGIAPLYSDLFYTSLSTSLALGGPNITGGALEARYPQKPNAVDAATGILGAGPSITVDLGRGAWGMVSGNVGEGSKDFIRSLPFMRLWFLKGFVNNMTTVIEGELDGPSGFKNY